MRLRRKARLPADILERISRLGVEPDIYQEWLIEEGANFVRHMLSAEEQSKELAEQWFPRLRMLESECRAKIPLPTIDSLDAIQRGQYEVYRKKIAAVEVFTRRHPHTVYEFSLPPVGLLAAQELWPDRLERSVLMTPDEWKQWAAIYQHPEEAFWWTVSYWWNIVIPPSEEEHFAFHQLPSGKLAWKVIEGVIWGSLAGGETEELWAWDGQQATFIETKSVSEF